MDYLTLKTIHIVSATVLFGVGLGSAFYKFCADRSGDVRAIAVVMRHVVIADWMFTTPAIIVQPITGLWLARIAGFALHDRWLWWSIFLYLVAGACWMPVVVLQIRMRNQAQAATSVGSALPLVYWKYARIWFWLGVPAFTALMVVFWLMVNKPI